MEQSQSQTTADLGICAVTGSSGWFASSLVSQLTQIGYKVYCLDIINSHDTLDENINPYCKINNKLTKYIQCDITKYTDLKTALTGVDTVFHVCSITDIRVCPSQLLTNVNINGTANVIKACRQCKVKQLIYTSSVDAVVDGKIKDQITENESWCTTFSQYGATKALSEQILLKVSDKHLAISILRMAHIYGPGDPIMFVTTKMPIRIGDETSKISLIYIENCAYAHIECAKALASKSTRSKCNKQIFNIKDHDDNFVHWYREILGEQTKSMIWIPYFVAIVLAYLYDYIVWIVFKLFGFRIGHPVESFGVLAVQAVAKEHTTNTDKYNKIIGYNPNIDVKESIKRTRDWRERKQLGT